MSKVAFVTGANGIAGAAIVRQLASEPDWKTIYAVSRRPGHSLPKDERVNFISLDLSEPASKITDTLRKSNVSGITHMYHTAYVEGQAEGDEFFDELVRLNVPMLTHALVAVNAISGDSLERVVLQTGGKHYGIFEQKPPLPLTEDQPRYNEGPPNFYYGQMDVLLRIAKESKWTWNETRPATINGMTKGNGMSFTTSMALYSLMQKHLGQPIIYGGPPELYEVKMDISTAENIAKFTSYISKKPEAANQSFNIVDNDPTRPSFRTYFELFGEYFGVPVERKEGYSIENAMKDKAKEWKELVKKHGGREEAFSYGTWKFLDMTFQKTLLSIDTSMEKAAQYGWTAQVDSKAAIRKVLDQMKEEGIIPKIF